MVPSWLVGEEGMIPVDFRFDGVLTPSVVLEGTLGMVLSAFRAVNSLLLSLAISFAFACHSEIICLG